jgi:hypothetical protein
MNSRERLDLGLGYGEIAHAARHGLDRDTSARAADTAYSTGLISSHTLARRGKP